MASTAVWAVDFIDAHPTVSLADYYEQDTASNVVGFLPHRPSLSLMQMIQRFVAERTQREKRKIESRRAFEEWQRIRRVEPSKYSLRDTVIVEESTLLLLDYDDLDGPPTRVGLAIFDAPPPMTFAAESLEARLTYAVFDIFRQRIMSNRR